MLLILAPAPSWNRFLEVCESQFPLCKMGRHALRGIIGDICLANLHRREVSIGAIARTPLFWDIFLVPPKLIPGRSSTPCTSGTPASGASPATDPKSAFGSAPPLPVSGTPPPWGRAPFPPSRLRGPWTPRPESSREAGVPQRLPL